MGNRLDRRARGKKLEIVFTQIAPEYTSSAHRGFLTALARFAFTLQDKMAPFVPFPIRIIVEFGGKRAGCYIGPEGSPMPRPDLAGEVRQHAAKGLYGGLGTVSAAGTTSSTTSGTTPPRLAGTADPEGGTTPAIAPGTTSSSEGDSMDLAAEELDELDERAEASPGAGGRDAPRLVLVHGDGEA